MDIVYAVGPGSIWQDNELRYSLRSVEKYLRGVDKVWVIGQCPKDIKPLVNFILMDNDGASREARIMNKIICACEITEISERFLFMNDDHFFIKETDIDLPYYSDSSLQEVAAYRRNRDAYQRSLTNTITALNEIEMPTHHFDIHCPIVYHKDTFKMIMGGFDWSVPFGYTIKSLYSNMAGVERVFMPDLKIDFDASEQQVEQLLKDRFVFSVGDRAILATKRTLRSLYPTPSKWEESL